jgi:hypothetical protein
MDVMLLRLRERARHFDCRYAQVIDVSS